ncbi:MAG: SUMF1/EgtB/PvdO family nonheme iron enzyme [Planctomycetes bacterium]|nr:SUMF1/EgtB/PvdO family nonheme iron enzyme [Planctomycetota bacterium]
MTNARSMEGRAHESSRLSPAVLAVLATTFASALHTTATSQAIEYGESRKAIPSPTGYPTNLVYIPKTPVKMGISASDVLDTAKEFGRGYELTKKYTKILVRELAGKNSTVLVDEFLIGRFEITNAEYEVFVKQNHPNVRFPFSWWKPASIDKCREKYVKEFGSNFKPQEYWSQNWRDLTTDWEVTDKIKNQAVGYVSLDDAKRYCAWAGVRLPFEVEWQAALQGPTKKPTRYLWGDKWENNCQGILGFQKRDVGKWPKTRSYYGVDDMIGGVWEYTASPLAPFDGMESEFRTLEKQWKRLLEKGDRDVLGMPIADGRFLVRGASFTSFGEAPITSRLTQRYAVPADATIEDFGFRIAKSLRPAFAGTVGRATFDLNSDNLGGLELDLPDRVSQRDGSMLTKDFEQRGIERWNMKDDHIQAYHMVSFVPVLSLGEIEKSKPKSAKDLEKITIDRSAIGAVGAPIAVVFSTEALSIQQGINKETQLPPGNYTVSFRSGGLPRDLLVALNEGRDILKRTKGVRPKAGDAAPAEDGKKDGDKGDKKADKKKEEAPQEPANDPFPVLDRFGVSDEITAKFPKDKPKTFLIQPGNLEIPAEQDVLLWRNDAGNYFAWSEYRPSVRVASVSQSPAKLIIDEAKSTLTYRGGPQTSRRGQRFEFQIEVKLVEPFGQNTWVTPDTKIEIRDPEVGPGEIQPKPVKK